MAEIIVDPDVFATVEDKVAVVLGGANGIGAATVTRLYRAGAHVCNSDWDVKSGTALTESLESSIQSDVPANSHVHGSIDFMQVDATDYKAQLKLFSAALAKHGRIDMAIYCVGIAELADGILPTETDIEKIQELPRNLLRVVDVNLNGCLYFTRIALVFLKQQLSSSSYPRSVTLVSSATAFQEAPGLYAYTATKAGIVGLMRATRALSLPIRINTILPWATETQMVAGQVDLFKNNNMPLQAPAVVAETIHQVAANPKMHGKSIFVGGGKYIDIEEGMAKSETQWLGDHVVKLFERQKEVFSRKQGEWNLVE